MNLEEYLYGKVYPIIQSWDEKGIYAISFYVYHNECNIYKGIPNFPEFSVGYNTEKGCSSAPKDSEERWNFAFWKQNNVPVIDAAKAVDGASFLLDWYREKNITDIGVEDEEGMYDENMNYIGKGPAGYDELLRAVSDVARRLQTEGVIQKKFGRIPILVHALEYNRSVEEATRNANPNGEADDFLNYLNYQKSCGGDSSAPHRDRDKKYPASLFWIGFLMNFILKYTFLLLPALVLMIVGIWVKICLAVGLILLSLDLLLSLAEQLRMRSVTLHSQDPEFNDFQDAILSKNWSGNIKKTVEEKMWEQTDSNDPPEE